MAATVMLNDMLPGHRVKVKVNIKLSFVAGVM